MSKEAMKMALEDCESHCHAWRSAMLLAKNTATTDSDKSYWSHELKAFDRTFRALADQPAQPIDEALTQALLERDTADDYIDALLDEVLGADRPEWSSAYGHADAIEQVRERITVLMKPSVDKAFDLFESEMKAQPAQQEQVAHIPDEALEQLKPLSDEQREEIAKGWRSRNWTVGDIINAIEAAHGIKGDA